MSEAVPTTWWMPEPGQDPEWERLGRELSIPAAGLAVLWNRGLRTRGQLSRFLQGTVEDLFDPFLLTDLAPAVDRILAACERREKVLVFGDSDVDGITATVLWTRALSRLGCEVLPSVPNRFREGFGLRPAALERAREQGATLLLVNDCGTTAHEALRRAQEMALDVVVIDHHVPDAVLPPCAALVNPHRPGDASPYHDLAAVGVAFKILQGLGERIGSAEYRAALLDDLDLVALGTIADQVPLTGENRILVRLGLARLREGARPALVALAEWIGDDLLRLSTERLARYLIPRLNACGRLGAPEHALELLLCPDLGQARKLAARVEEDNRRRRLLTERVVEEAMDRVERQGPVPSLIVLADPEWHPGVLGIAASRMAERFEVPVLLISPQADLARGSARCLPGINLLHLLESARPHLVSCGGHPRAVGIALAPDRLEDLHACLREAARGLPPAAKEGRLRLDASLDPGECSLELTRWIDQLSPFGPGNEEPVFFGQGLCRKVRVEDGRHLRFVLGAGARAMDCVGFGLGALADEIPPSGAYLELAYRPMINLYQHRERVQLKLNSFRFAEPGRV
jgi:single-stranded-DNA-specific exonuclease